MLIDPIAAGHEGMRKVKCNGKVMEVKYKETESRDKYIYVTLFIVQNNKNKKQLWEIENYIFQVYSYLQH